MTQEERLERMPTSCRATYRRAMEGRSQASAVKSFCQECMGYQEARFFVRDCTDTGCPLFPYRPYQKRASSDRKTPMRAIPEDGPEDIEAEG